MSQQTPRLTRCFVLLLLLLLAAGVLSDHVLKRVSRLEVLAGVLGSMACAHGLLVLSSPTLLFPCLVFVGICYGATFSMMATIMGAFDFVSVFAVFMNREQRVHRRASDTIVFWWG